MKKQIFTLSFALCAAFGYSQTSNSSSWPTSGPVGIGTTTPSYKLHVVSNVIGTPLDGFAYTDNLACIGKTATSGLMFQALGIPVPLPPPFDSSNTTARAYRLQMAESASVKAGYVEFSTPATTNTTKAAVSFGNNGVELMRINQNGKIRIGTNNRATPDGYRLFVEEGILTERVKVAVSTTANWADYVFAPEYKLMPLEEVEQFTKENNHLPNVPSADEMVTDGLDVAQMDAKLLEKIEELTLYIIDQNKTNEAQAKEIAELKAMMKAVLEKNN